MTAASAGERRKNSRGFSPPPSPSSPPPPSLPPPPKRSIPSHAHSSIVWRKETNSNLSNRAMEYISRSPTFGDFFVTIRTERLMQKVTVTARLQSTRVQTSSPLSFKYNVLRESLSLDSQNIPCASLKRRGSWMIFLYLCFQTYCTACRIARGS
jgi:hypothetical protein